MEDKDKTKERLIEELQDLRKQSKDALKESEENFRRIFEECPIGIAVVNPDFSLKIVNPSFCQIMGYTKQELEKLTFIDITHPDDVDKDAELARKVFTREIPFYQIEKRYITKTGEIIWVSLTASLTLQYDGQTLGLGMVEDITERIKIEEVLTKTTEQLTTLVTSLPVIPYTAKAKGDFGATYVSPRVFKLTGHLPEDFTSDSEFWPNHIHPDDIEMVFAEMPKVFEKDFLELEYRYQISDGSYQNFLDVLRVVKNQEGEIDHIAGVWYDITERKQLENQLLQSRKLEALGRLSGGIAHDFNNILGAMKGNLQLYFMEVPDDHVGNKYVKTSQQFIERATKLVHQILTFSKMEVTNLKPVNLIPVIQDSMKMLESTIPSNIKIVLTLQQGCGISLLDVTQFYQVISNLCINSLQAMHDSGGTIEIILEEVTECPNDLPDGNYLKLSVKDDGAGIPLEFQEKVFDPFFTTKKVGEGTGLGLSVISGIIEKHNGKITLESEVGRGSIFSIFIPVVDKEIQEKPKEVSRTAKKITGNILVAEDEPEILNIYRIFLKRRGHTVFLCENGKEALDLFKEDPNKFDLILTDQKMPKMGGDVLCKEILKLRPDVPIIMATGFNDMIPEDGGHQKGNPRYLLKAIDLPVLQESIEELLSSSKQGIDG